MREPDKVCNHISASELYSTRVIVSGGAGFIGSYLVDALASAGHHVIVIDDFSTGSVDNLAKWKGDPRLDIIESDLSVDV